MARKDKLKIFSGGSILPENEGQAKNWQNNNKSWWEKNPMRYDWKEPIGASKFSNDYYKEIDKRFFQSAYQYMPYKKYPFEKIIDFTKLGEKDVLEIGVGNGSHAQILATESKSFTGIDITEYAIESVENRMKLNKINAQIIQMDAEKMEFKDQSFDFVWSWGVIHHSSNTEKIIKEIHRVLRDEGEAVIMVYHRGFWNYYFIPFFRSILDGSLFKEKSLELVVQNYTDGAIARYYTPKDWEKLVEDNFQLINISVYGQKGELFPIPGGGVKNFIMGFFPNFLTRFFTNKLRFGSFLVSHIKKIN